MSRLVDQDLTQNSEPLQQPLLENPQGVQAGPDFYNTQTNTNTSRQGRSRAITVTMIFAFIVAILFNGAAAFHWQDLKQENTQIKQEITTTLNDSSRL